VIRSIQAGVSLFIIEYLSFFYSVLNKSNYKTYSLGILFVINSVIKITILFVTGFKIKPMYKITGIFMLVFIFNLVSAQKVFSVKYSNQADVKVFVVGYENQADLAVYKVKYENQVGDNDGKWFFTDYENQAKKKIYFVDYENQADLKIFFVEYENQAGWKNKEKIYLMY
jgi:hypothetical protein